MYRQNEAKTLYLGTALQALSLEMCLAMLRRRKVLIFPGVVFYFGTKYNTIQYNTIQYNTIQYNRKPSLYFFNIKKLTGCGVVCY